jgi:hypothetical protein
MKQLTNHELLSTLAVAETMTTCLSLGGELAPCAAASYAAIAVAGAAADAIAEYLA